MQRTRSGGLGVATTPPVFVPVALSRSQPCPLQASTRLSHPSPYRRLCYTSAQPSNLCSVPSTPSSSSSFCFPQFGTFVGLPFLSSSRSPSFPSLPLLSFSFSFWPFRVFCFTSCLFVLWLRVSPIHCSTEPSVEYNCPAREGVIRSLRWLRADVRDGVVISSPAPRH